MALLANMDGSDADLCLRLQGCDHDALVKEIKQRADEHMDGDVKEALRCGELIIRIGRALDTLSYVALGTMVIGDATYSQGDPRGAWDFLEQAGQLFQQADDEVGWARTRIGRTRLGVPLDRVPLVLADADLARQILIKHERWDRLMILLLNLGALHDQMRNYAAALEQYAMALDIVEKLPESHQLPYRAWLSNNLGCAHLNLGNFRLSREFHQRAHDDWQQLGDPHSQALASLNLALLDQLRGNFRQALATLHKVVPLLPPPQAVTARLNIIHCYLELRDFATVRDFALDFINECKASSFLLEASTALLRLADAYAELGEFDAAKKALDEAAELAPQRDTASWQAVVHLRRAYINLKDADIPAAQASIKALGDDAEHHYVRIISLLLHGEIAYSSGDVEATRSYADRAITLADEFHLPRMEYRARLLLAKLNEQLNRPAEALHEYAEAADIVDRVQRGLTITFRPSWLEDNKEALHSVVRLHLNQNEPSHTIAALEAIERLKSQVLLGYMLNRDALKWSPTTAAETALVDQLNELRSQYQQLLDQLDSLDTSTVKTRQNLELQMRTITERLFLSRPDNSTDIQPLHLDQLLPHLPPETALIEYFDDGLNIWAFTVCGGAIHQHQLDSSAVLREAALRLKRYINRAVAAGPHSPALSQLHKQTDKELRALYDGLLMPLASMFTDAARLYIVPYGFLHTIPFQLLYDGVHYLSECHEVVIEPAAGLLTWTPRPQPKGACVIAHTANGRLPYALVEGEAIAALTHGTLYQEDGALRERLVGVPAQILHIAAHGAHHPQQPNLSFIQLADGPLWADDVFQFDMNYELVTLSACETGRAQPSGGDELIGLGRGFLYAGAGALITSLWQVNDAIAVDFMRHFYDHLLKGHSKAAAMHAAQRTLLANHGTLHPAFWGAFQLVGNADALS
ncbi:MAG: CHAT domain-containing protein [Anaerolineae bacterium]|nr:CHAT domain-containing protein [Anaerolineae bacterium]